MEFVYGGASAPEEIRVRAYRTDVPRISIWPRDRADLRRKRASTAGRTGLRRSGSLPSRRARIVADLWPPGRYLFIVSVREDDETAEGEARCDFYDVAVE